MVIKYKKEVSSETISIKTSSDEGEIDCINVKDAKNDRINWIEVATAQRCFYCKNIKLESGDLERLQNGEWFNDKLINCYYKLLGEKRADCKFLDTFFVKTLFKANDKNRKMVTLGYKECRRSWLKYKKLFIPIHSGSHWYLLMCDFETIHVLDSLSKGELQISKEILNIKLTIENVIQKKLKIYCLTNIPQQRNGNDCGVFLCMYTKTLAFGMKFYRGNMHKYRNRIAHELLAHKIIYGHRKIYIPGE